MPTCQPMLPAHPVGCTEKQVAATARSVDFMTDAEDPTEALVKAEQSSRLAIMECIQMQAEKLKLDLGLRDQRAQQTGHEVVKSLAAAYQVMMQEQGRS